MVFYELTGGLTSNKCLLNELGEEDESLSPPISVI